MKAYSAKEIKDELKTLPPNQLLELIQVLIRFKKENKELLSYLLFESQDEETFIQSVQLQIDGLFEEINTNSYFYMRKTARKILNLIKKYVRFSKKKETEIELLIYYCQKLNQLRPSIKKSKVLFNIYQRQILSIEKSISLVHEDLQHDYIFELNQLKQD